MGRRGSQKTIPVTDTSKFKKEKNIKNYYYYNNYTTILSGERYLAKNAKKQVRFLHTKHSTKYLCLKLLKEYIILRTWPSQFHNSLFLMADGLYFESVSCCYVFKRISKKLFGIFFFGKISL